MKMHQKHKTLTGFLGQEELIKMAVDTTVRRHDKTVESCSCTTDVQYLLLTNSNNITLSRGDLLSPSMAVFVASLEIVSETEASIDLLTNI